MPLKSSRTLCVDAPSARKFWTLENKINFSIFAAAPNLTGDAQQHPARPEPGHVKPTHWARVPL
jgi:hypothetical protein